MIDKIKIFNNNNNKNLAYTGTKPRKSKNIFETPIKAEIKNYIQNTQNTKMPKKNSSIETEHVGKEIRQNKFVWLQKNNDDSSYTKQNETIKSISKNNQDPITNIFVIGNKNKMKNNNKSVEHNLIYNKFIDNLKLGIERDNNINNDNSKKTKNKKKKNILGDFLNQFVNKIHTEEPNINQFSNRIANTTKNNKKGFKNIHKIKSVNIFIESTKKPYDNKNSNYNESDEIKKMRKELEIKDNKIKQLLKNVKKIK